MKSCLTSMIVLLGVCFAGKTLHAEDAQAPTSQPAAPAAVVLKPNAIIRLEFPELSDNLATMFSGQKVPNLVLAHLPANYTPEGKFPIVIYIDGGNGGIVLKTERLREALGPDDFIAVRLPSFKAAKIKTDPAGGVMILPKDYEVISHNYRVMLQKLYDTVPNITPERSTIGGFSNGAHATGILLKHRDEFILKHFTHFYLVEGGIQHLGGDTLQNPALRGSHFLLMLGDRGRETSPFENPRFGKMGMDVARELGIDYRAIPMKGYGHEMPLDYLKLLGFWLRGQPFPDIAPKATPATNTPAAESAPVTLPSTQPGK